ncbi:MAG TPA: heparinase II/III family protein [Opitutaceae bacterium]|nr:heparinase II/III family protein [Opitutaceae bacterium]
MIFRKPTTRILILAVAFISSFGARAAEPTDTVNAQNTIAVPDPLANLRPKHPRLFANNADWDELKGRISADKRLADVNAVIIADARVCLRLRPLERHLIGRRMLAVSRALVPRILSLSYAWRVTGETEFARRAETEMLAAAAFTDWNPSHFLDVAEAVAALGIGYDWCYDALSPESRATIRRALVEKAFRPAFDPAVNNWIHTTNNWNQVCLGGLTVAALAIGDEEPVIAREILNLAHANIHNGLAPYEPDGVYPEGPSYWAYGTSYQVLMIAALESALGTDWDLPRSPGFLASASFVVQATGATGRLYNFSDGVERAGHEPALYWFAEKLHDPGLLMFNLRLLETSELKRDFESRNRFFPFTALWWPAHLPENPVPSLPLRWTGRGKNPIAVFRGGWTDPDAIYLALKGGSAGLNHAHMDAGSFVFELDNVRWAIDLGLQDYESIESKGIDLWSRTQNSQRWRVYRLNNYSHSTLTIDGQLHRVDGAATIMRFSAKDPQPFAVVDLSPVFQGQAVVVHRGFKLLDARTVLIQDELRGLKPGAVVHWQFPTRAKVAVKGNTASLRESGRMLQVNLVSDIESAAGPSRMPVFTSAPANPPVDNFNAPNPGVTLVGLDFTAPENGTLRYGVIFSDEAQPDAENKLTPLESWAGAYR